MIQDTAGRLRARQTAFGDSASTSIVSRRRLARLCLAVQLFVVSQSTVAGRHWLGYSDIHGS